MRLSIGHRVSTAAMCVDSLTIGGDGLFL